MAAEAEFYSPPRRLWLIVILLALLLHALLLIWKPQFDLPAPPPRVEVQEVDPAKLDQIRKQWRQKSLLLDKTPKAKSDQLPENARYESDRNIRVEKEQRARQTDVIPRPFKPGAADQEKAAKSRSRTKVQSAPMPKLGSLGVPFDLNRQPPSERPDTEDQQRSERGQPGGDQAVLDRNLPEGSENMLNAQESVYYSFYARLYESIGPIWSSLIREIPSHRRVVPGDYVTEVDVVFDAHGNLLGVRSLHGSGLLDFDQAVETAWKKIGQFPNPPKGLLDANGEVHTGWTFQVRVDEGFNMLSAPPERNY